MSVILSDQFNRTGALDGSTAGNELGGIGSYQWAEDPATNAWQTIAGQDRAIVAAIVGSNRYASIGPAYADQRVTLSRLDANYGWINAGAARYTDPTNYGYFWFFNGYSGEVYLYSAVNGQIGYYVNPSSYNLTAQFALECIGTSIKLYIGGSPVISAVDVGGASSGKAGILSLGGNVNVVSDFIYEADTVGGGLSVDDDPAPAMIIHQLGSQKRVWI